jgi:hypothetical protein
MVIGLDLPSEKYLHGNNALVMRWLQAGLQVQPALRDELLARAIGDLLDPALDALRPWRARSVAEAARLAPRSVSATVVARVNGDSPATRARKAWLSVLIEPDSDERLGDFVQ